ncbi:MAG: EF-hand domain-containing protein [Devosia sp.]|nr:EF-hand domain-containing protein [Devosia sp.]
MSINGVGSGAMPMRAFQPPSFSAIDSDTSGGISLEELKASGPPDRSGAQSTERAERLFLSMDKDGNGSVTSEEKDAFDSKVADQRQAMQFMTQLMSGGSRPPSNADIFSATDTDGSGAVSFEEFAASDGAETISDEDLQALFSSLDADGDRSISETESSDFLDSLKTALTEAGPEGPAGRPGGPPPDGNSGGSEDDDSDTLALDLLAAAQAAYASTTQSEDLLSMLSKMFDSAA